MTASYSRSEFYEKMTNSQMRATNGGWTWRCKECGFGGYPKWVLGWHLLTHSASKRRVYKSRY